MQRSDLSTQEEEELCNAIERLVKCYEPSTTYYTEVKYKGIDGNYYLETNKLAISISTKSEWDPHSIYQDLNELGLERDENKIMVNKKNYALIPAIDEMIKSKHIASEKYAIVKKQKRVEELKEGVGRTEQSIMDLEKEIAEDIKEINKKYGDSTYNASPVSETRLDTLKHEGLTFAAAKAQLSQHKT